MSEGLFLFAPLDAPADLRAETAVVPISPLDEVRVLRPGTEVEVAEGEAGELAARGPYTICGYLAAPDRDREAFTAEGFYRSGDLVRARRYEGSLSYSSEGRVNDLVDRGGEKVNAEEVEVLVAGHPAVAEMALVGMPDPRLDEPGCAYVVPRDPQNPPTLAGICAYLHPAQAGRHGVTGGTGRGRDWCYEVHRAFCGSHLPPAVASRSGSRNGVTVGMASSSVRAFGRRERAASAA